MEGMRGALVFTEDGNYRLHSEECVNVMPLSD